MNARKIFLCLAVLALAFPLFAQDAQRDRDVDQSSQKSDQPPPDRDRQRSPDTAQGKLEPQLRPPIDERQGRWILGVSVDNSETGVLVTRVFPNSAAWRMGLERDDVILTVNGYQVGSVDGRVYELGDELQKRADRDGRVLLLIRNHRDGGLIAREAKLTRQEIGIPERPDRGDSVTGKVMYRERILLPRTAELTVQLVEAPRLGAQGRVIAEQRIANPGGSTDFELRFDPADIDARRLYSVDAKIMVDGRLWYANTDTHFVITRGNPKSVEILVRSMR